MKVNITIGGQQLMANMHQPIFIGLKISDKDNPNCYFTEPPRISPVESTGFIGDIKQGGSVNHKQIRLAPHGNGTHTECSGHIFDNNQTIDEVLKEQHFIAKLISIKPTIADKDVFVDLAAIKRIAVEEQVKALVIRTLPNEESKRRRNYSGTNPPYIEVAAMKQIVELGIEHLIVDLPSVDPEVDEGRLKAHNIFWANEQRRNQCTITELAFVPNDVPDGNYLLNLQTLRLGLDASPSNPVLYSLTTR